MATFDYTGLQNTAYNLIVKFGTTVTITRKNAVENPVTGVSDAAAATTGTLNVVSVPASKTDFDDKIIGMAAEIGTSAKFFIAYAVNAAFDPAPPDYITFGSKNYSVLGSTKIAPAGSGSEIIYRIGVAV